MNRKHWPRLGILGGGQLARMLAIDAAQMGFTCSILSPQPEDPAAQVSSHWQKGDVNDLSDVLSFCQQIDLLTFESELISQTVLEKLSEQKNIKIFPDPKLLSILQNRRTQKQILQKYKIPTSPWSVWEKSQSPSFAFPFVIKKCLGGYDGNGTFVIKNQEQLNQMESHKEAIVEKFIPFRRELAIVLLRSENGSFAEFPLVQSHQVDHRCDWILGPTQSSHSKKLVTKLKKMMADLNYIGALAFEIFDTGKELLINEMAPRVHNTAHYSQNALSHSQFLLHWLAGLGTELPQPQLMMNYFCMVNLIGTGEVISWTNSIKNGYLHWYGKSSHHKGRKLGHINFMSSDNPKKLLQHSLKQRKKFLR